MTVENVDALERAVVNTTEGGPGLAAVSTGVRITATGTNTYGYGLVNPERAVTDRETSVVDPTVLAGAGVGTLAFFMVDRSDTGQSAVIRRLL